MHSDLLATRASCHQNCSCSSSTLHTRRAGQLIMNKYSGTKLCNSSRFTVVLLFQVIALSKQQGLLHSPRSEDGGSTVSCTGSIRYRALTDQDPSPPASTTGAMGGGGLCYFQNRKITPGVKLSFRSVLTKRSKIEAANTFLNSS